MEDLVVEEVTNYRARKILYLNKNVSQWSLQSLFKEGQHFDKKINLIADEVTPIKISHFIFELVHIIQ